MVVLKRLADAERDGDRVYAIVQAVGVASDGRGHGLAAPSARGTEGVALFADHPPVPHPAEPFALADPRASRFTAGRLYGEQWLFHGPPFQALTAVGPVSLEGISGSIRVLPLGDRLRPGLAVRFSAIRSSSTRSRTCSAAGASIAWSEGTWSSRCGWGR